MIYHEDDWADQLNHLLSWWTWILRALPFIPLRNAPPVLILIGGSLTEINDCADLWKYCWSKAHCFGAQCSECILDQFTKTFFWNFQSIRADLCYILIYKQMLEKAFCSNIAPSLSSGNHLFYKAEYMGQSCPNQVWAITFDWSALATWNKHFWTAFWKLFSGIPHLPGLGEFSGARCSVSGDMKGGQVGYPWKGLSKCSLEMLISGR